MAEGERKTQKAKGKTEKAVGGEATQGVADFEEAKKRADRLIAKLTEGRNPKFVLWDQMYRLEPQNMPDTARHRWIKPLYDPLPHNIVEMIVRMYSESDPTISVPTPKGEVKLRETADKAERFLRAVLFCSNRTSRRLMQNDLFHALTIFDEETINVDPWILFDPDATCPFVFDVPHPILCYPHYGRRGVGAHVQTIKMQKWDVEQYFSGKESKSGAKMDTSFLTGEDEQELTVYDYADMSWRHVWAHEQPEKAILSMEHGLGFVPREAGLGTAPSFEELEKNKRMSVLFALDVANLWYASNLMLTLSNSANFAYFNPHWVAKLREIKRALSVDLSATGDTTKLYTDESLEPLHKQLITPEMLQMLSQVQVMMETSTMPKIVAGASPFAGITASATHTLSTNARLIAQPIARCAGWATANVMSIVLRMIGYYGLKVSVYGGDGQYELEAADVRALGGNPIVEVTYKPDVTMEKQINMQIGQAMWAMGLGFDTTLEFLEQSNIVRSAGDAMQDMLLRRFIEQNLPAYAQEAAKRAGAELASAAKISGMGLSGPASLGNVGAAPPAPPSEPASASAPNPDALAALQQALQQKGGGQTPPEGAPT